MNSIHKMTRNKNLPILIILFVGLILGISIFTNFGASWDEPEYYQYADSTLRAYSITDRLAGTFKLNLTLGPTDLRYYGPAFLIIGKGIHALLALIFPHTLSIDLWHLIIYFSFLLGAFFFYKIAQRWVSTLAATIATLLFISQPVLFGMSWINPKDIPFMVFFMGAIYFGLYFSDQAGSLLGTRTKVNAPTLPGSQRGIKTKAQKFTFLLSVCLSVISGLLFIQKSAIKKVLSGSILSLDVNHPRGLIQICLVRLAHNLQTLPLTLYANKAVTIFNDLLGFLLILTLLSLLVMTGYLCDSNFFKNRALFFKSTFQQYHEGYALYPHKAAFILSFVGACFFLGFASATRILGPFAALLVVWIWARNLRQKSIPVIIVYAVISFLIFFACWPFLWQDTWKNLLTVINQMANFPVGMNVLFAGKTLDSRALPASYLPTLLAKTLTEPALLLILMGLVVLIYRLIKKEDARREMLIPLVWFFVPFLYILIFTPPMYDNYRHFLFILPALFLFSAFAIDFICSKMKNRWLDALIIFLILSPELLDNVQLHPYEYAYYNSLAGGLKGAANQFDEDYWLTCYKGLTEQINANEKGQVNVYVDSAPALVKFYANKNIIVKATDNITYPPGSLILLPLRWSHEMLFPDYPIAYAVELNGVKLCVAKRVP